MTRAHRKSIECLLLIINVVYLQKLLNGKSMPLEGFPPQKKSFSRPNTHRRSVGGLLFIEDLLKVFYASMGILTAGRSSINRRPVESIFSIVNLEKGCNI